MKLETFKAVKQKDDFYISVNYVGINSDYTDPSPYYKLLDDKIDELDKKIEFNLIIDYVRCILLKFKETKLFVSLSRKNEEYTIYIENGKIVDYKVYKRFGRGKEVDIHYINEGENDINISIKNNGKYKNEDITKYINNELLPFLLIKKKRS